ncbi:zinc finger Y-chromosomal protein-like isoform X1 [Hyalella azteca]|uniref:Zinc finger Y-chromosomal protein-like isoform X1 n=1 Tax=Hyalella azteca TaxID=294128 RepID=A0A8B7NAJ8_HYAAZ|nr:zinc finger Y-chromosomal protein-like isoform X1 [Hyalella azteca]
MEGSSSSLPSIMTVYIKEEPGDEGEDITVKDEPLCSEEYEQTPLRSSCKPCKKEVQVEAHEACTSASQYTAAVPHKQDVLPCNAQSNIGQDEWMAVSPENKEKNISAAEKNISPVPNRAALVQEVLFDQPVAEFKSFESNLPNKDNGRLAEELHEVSSSTDSSHSKAPFNAHQLNKIDFGSGFKCKLCNYVMAIKRNLCRHLFSKHSFGEGFKCKLCDYAAGRQTQLKVHMFFKHGLGKSVKCDVCDYVTAQKQNLERHLFVEHGLGEGYKCDLCDYVTAQIQNLRNHLYSKHGLGKGFKCKLCDYAAGSKVLLSRHLSSKHGLGGLKCKLCDYSARDKSHLNEHMFSKHGMGKGFQCKRCDYVSCRKDGLDRHMFSKHGLGKGFPCDFCDYVTAKKCYLTKHLKSKHVLDYEKFNSTSSATMSADNPI